MIAPAYSYNETASQRDLRIDYIRGFAMLFVVVDHVNLRSGYHIITHEGLGVFTGAEIFVMISGFILGTVNRRRLLHNQTLKDVWKKLGRRAFTIYKLALAIAVVLFFFKKTGWINVTALTSYQNPSGGEPVDLFNDQGLSVAALVLKFVSIQFSPSELNILGLYVVLLLITPLVIWLLKHKKPALVLIICWTVYAANEYIRIRITPAAFERPFPLLSWQVFFFTGLVAGWYKEVVFNFFRSRPGIVALGLIFLGGFLIMFYSLNNPWEPVPYGARLRWISEYRFTGLYQLFFQRSFPGVGRIASVVVFIIVLYTLLTQFWQPVNRLTGWFFIPIGQASLYVFAIHILFILLVVHIPYLQHSTVKMNTLIHTIILMLIWLMVQYRVLFRFIPR